MPLIEYKIKNFKGSTLDIIDKANEIIDEYAEAGFDLTVRQLYYQFVSRDIIDNNQKEYSRLASIINDGRLAGLIDWESIVDRTRYLRSLSHWNNVSDILKVARDQYRVDKWSNQSEYCEVWIEKDALIGVIERVCNKYDVPYMSCRGYISQSEMWRASQRLIEKDEQNKMVTILHFSDHDPSGINMTEDIRDRLEMFDANVSVKRVALTEMQVDQYNLPPNPTKLTDSRADKYKLIYGDKSWELDALDPGVLSKLIDDSINTYINQSKWNKMLQLEHDGRNQINQIILKLENRI
jgi:hypothetical protein